MYTHIWGAKDVKEDGEELSKHGKDLIFCQVRLDELCKDLHSAVHGVGGEGGEESDESIEQVGVFIWPVAVCY